jgi:hypothetical protein
VVVVVEEVVVVVVVVILVVLVVVVEEWGGWQVVGWTFCPRCRLIGIETSRLQRIIIFLSLATEYDAPYPCGLLAPLKKPLIEKNSLLHV